MPSQQNVKVVNFVKKDKNSVGNRVKEHHECARENINQHLKVLLVDFAARGISVKEGQN